MKIAHYFIIFTRNLINLTAILFDDHLMKEGVGEGVDKIFSVFLPASHFLTIDAD